MLEKIKKELKQLEISIANIKEYTQAEQDKQIKEKFIELNSPLDRIPIFKNLDTKIRQIDDGVGFRITEGGLVYQINEQNFVAIYPQVNALKLHYATPDDWKDCKLTDVNEIDGAIVLIKESCDFIRKKTKK